MKEGLTFDDVALVPSYNNIPSRLEPDLSTWLCRDLKIDIPILAANMDTVIGEDLAEILISYGTYPIYHRFTEFDKQKEWVNKFQDKTFISAGLNDFEKVIQLLDLGAKGVCMDIAHAHDKRMLEFLNKLSTYLQKRGFEDRKIIAGNVCTAVGYVDLVNAGADAVKVGIGSGCHTEDTRVLMSNGTYKNIKDINIGDRIINLEGTPVTVIGKKKTGIKKVIKIKPRNWHKDVFVTPEHRYFMANLQAYYNKNSSSLGNWSMSLKSLLSSGVRGDYTGVKKYDWIPIGKLDRSKFTLLPEIVNFELRKCFKVDLSAYATIHSNITDNYIETAYGPKKVKLNRFISSDYKLGYIFGLFLGDGCASSHNISFKFNRRGEDKIVEKLTQYLKDVFAVSISKYDEGNVIRLQVSRSILFNFFSKFGKKSNKKLPDDLYCLDKNYVQGLYDGLVDSDGTVSKSNSRVSFNNTSDSLIELFYFCCIILGKSFSSFNKKLGTSLSTLNLENCSNLYEINTHSKEKFSRGFQYSDSQRLGEVCIDMEVWDIEVDCPTHSFIANNCIVHNSACTTRLVTGYGIPQVTAILDCAEMAKKYSVPIISDGSIRTSADIVKALSAGACSVMIGKLFALTEESAAEKRGGSSAEYGLPDAVTGLPRKRNVYNPRESKYRGQASEDFQKDYRGGVKDGTVAEGVDFWAPVSGTAKDLIENLIGGIRSGMTYGGARHIDELQRKASFVKVNAESYKRESNPRPE